MKNRNLTKTAQRGWASAVTLCVVIVLYFVMRTLIVNKTLNSYYVGIINMIFINIIAAVGLNIVTGFLGQLVLGHAGFMLIGAYFCAIFTKTVAWPLPYSLPIGIIGGGVFAAIIGFLIGLPALRLRGDYLAIITLGFGEILRIVANNLKITNGAKGYSGFPTFSMKKEPAALFTIVFFVAVFVIYFSYTFGMSRHGRAIISIREDEIASESNGVNTTYYKLMAFTLSAFFGGVAGSLLIQQLNIVDPSSFGFAKSVDYLMMVVLGGMGSITGSIISTTVLTALPEILRAFAEWRTLIYSVVLILVMLFRPGGLFGRKEMRVIPLYSKIFPFMQRKEDKKVKVKKADGGVQK